MIALTQNELKEMTCDHSDHDVESCDNNTLYLHAACHPDDPTWASYSEGIVTIECSVCEKIIVKIVVQP